MPKIKAVALSDLLIQILIDHKVSEAHASLITKDLIHNETNGYPSHGVFRLSDYIKAIHEGRLDPTALPTRSHAGFGWLVDGHNGFGVLAIQEVTDIISTQLDQQGIVIVGLRNCGRIGRLASLGRSIAESGNIVLGFSNFRGAGKRVAPLGGQTPLLSTNPFLFACPRGEKGAFILDMSTSTVAEGKIRSSWLNKTPLPTKNWLYNLLWQPTDDASGLYSSPPTALLAPLGNLEAGHKGFGLAMMVDIMSGILTGGEFACSTQGPGGNGGLFIGLRPDCLGISSEIFQKNVEEFCVYCESSKVADGFLPIRAPGNNKISASELIELPESVYNSIQSLQNTSSSLNKLSY